MKMGDAIKKAMSDKGIGQTQMAKMIGAKSQSVIAERLRRDNLSVDTVLEMLSLVGYELVIQETKPGRRPEGQIVIGGE